jgi:hypothetical protein
MIERRRRRLNRVSQEKPEDELPVQWQKIQGAIWLAGLAILLWKGWIFPGIFVLLAISGLFQAGVMFYLKNQETQQAKNAQLDQLAAERASWLPPTCPSCGGPISVEKVHWTGSASATCPYCSANIRPAS